MRSLATLAAAAVAATVLLLAPATPAFAHAALRASTPARDARLTVAPADISLDFTENLNAAFTTIALRDAGQRVVPTSKPTVTGRITIDSPPPNGIYTVAYPVVSTDGHAVQGSYQFTVDDPNAPPATVGSPVTSTVPTDADAADAGGTSTTIAAGAVVLVAVMLAGVVVVMYRRRNRIDTRTG